MNAGLASRLIESPAAKTAARALDGTRAWIVGGAIRDAVLGDPVTDVDLAVPAGQQESATRAVARALGGHAFELSGEHGTWRAVAAASDERAGIQVDIAALRGDTIEADLAARDFAANAVAVPLEGGEPIDPLGGIADIEARRLRLASPDAYRNDPLRLLRAVRFCAALGFELDADAERLAAEQAALAVKPAGERQFAELSGIICSRDPLRGLELMDRLGLTAHVLPELAALHGVEQNPNHHLDVHGHTIEVLRRWLEFEAAPGRLAGEANADGVAALLDEPLADGLTRRDALRFGALVHDMGKPVTRAVNGDRVSFIGHDDKGAGIIASLCSRLRTSRVLSSYLQDLTRHHLRLGFMVHERPLSRRRIYEYLDATDPVAADVTLLTVADRLSARGTGSLASDEMITAHLELVAEMLAEALPWHREGGPRPPLSGSELINELGAEPGPGLGRVLEELRAASFAGEITGRDQALSRARELLAG